MTLDVSKATAYAVLQGETLDVSKVTAYAVLIGDTLDVSKVTAYGIVYTPPDRRLSRIITEPVVTGDVTDVRMPLMIDEPTTGGNPVVRCPLIVLECIHSIPEEPPVPTEIIPLNQPIIAPLIATGLPGLTFSSHKKPMWRTDEAKAVSGRRVAAARMEVPIWQFEIKFDYLDSRDGADPAQQFETLAGFFNTMRGRWANWLYQDPTDYMVQSQTLGVGDGGETMFYLQHQFGQYREPVGQVDLAALMSFAAGAVTPGTDTIAVPNHGLYTGYGPMQITNPGTLPTGLTALTNYWMIKMTSGTFKLASSYANAMAGTPVDITATGAGTNTLSNSVAVYNDGVEVPPADYTVTMPNQIVFDSAPGIGDIITSDCKFYFICHFMDDIVDFEQFMYKLWTLETLEFETDLV